MTKKRPAPESSPNADATPESASWFDAMMSRRQFSVATAVAVAAVGAGVAATTACTRKETVQYDEQESLTLQREAGWSYGDTTSELRFRDAAEHDVMRADRWRAYNTAAALGAVFPATEKTQLLGSTALVDALDSEVQGDTLAAQMRPVFRPSMEESYQRGVALANALARQQEDLAATLVILDLPGTESVAAATGMASVAEPVLHLDNWPHPRGVVPAHETLGALLYYAPELDDARQARSAEAPTVLVLDRGRLPEGDIDETRGFDNRYGVMMPSIDALRANGIERVLYVTPESGDEELDDLNEFFAVLSEQNAEVKQIAMSDFQPASEEALRDASTAFAAAGVAAGAAGDGGATASAEAAEAIPGTGATGAAEEGVTATPDSLEESATTEQEYHEQRRYYYGGSPFGSYFLMGYLMGRGFSPAYVPANVPRSGRVAPPPTRTVRPRPTAFSQRYTGTSFARGSAVGSARPSGLGRVTVPVDSAGRRTGGYLGPAAAAAAASSRAGRAGGTTRTAPARQSSPRRSTGSPGRGVYSGGG